MEQTFGWPAAAARMSGVAPLASVSVGSAPNSIKLVAKSANPKWAAAHKIGTPPSASVWTLAFAPESSNKREICK